MDHARRSEYMLRLEGNRSQAGGLGWNFRKDDGGIILATAEVQNANQTDAMAEWKARNPADIARGSAKENEKH